jgi:hypothetical protein
MSATLLEAALVDLADRGGLGERFGFTLWLAVPEDDELHQKEIAQGRARYREELGYENIVSERGEAEMDDRNGDEPVGKNYAEVLNKLFPVVAAPAAKDPELVQ